MLGAVTHEWYETIVNNFANVSMTVIFNPTANKTVCFSSVSLKEDDPWTIEFWSIESWCMIFNKIKQFVMGGALSLPICILSYISYTMYMWTHKSTSIHVYSCCNVKFTTISHMRSWMMLDYWCQCTGSWDPRKVTNAFLQGLYSLSGKTSYRQISRSLEVARLDVTIIVSLWNLTGISAALLPRCLSNFRAIGKV